MNISKAFLKVTTAVFTVAVVLFSTEASNGQGRYANRYSKRDVSNIINRMETSSDEFRRDFDRAMDNSDLNGTAQETRFNNLVRDFENAVDRLRREFDRNNTWWNSRNDVQNMIRDASPVNTMMTSLPFRRNIERQWNALRNSINAVADTYDLPGLNGGGWQGSGGGGGGGWNGGGGAGNVPDWARGTFYGRDPQTGETVTMNIERNGSVTISVDGGQPVYASMNRTTLNNGPYVARVTRINNGIRTTDVSNGRSIDYYTTPVGGGGGGNVPDWARGTFYGRDPQTGGSIVLEVQRNGNVIITTDGGNPVYGSMTGTTLRNGPYVARVTRISNGFRTTDVNNSGNYIDYYATPNGGGGGDGGVGGDVPDWARGTFYGRDPQTGSNIVLSIQRNGNVTISVDGAEPVFASMNGTRLTNGQYVSRVTRINNGIRTADVNSGRSIDYYRR